MRRPILLLFAVAMTAAMLARSAAPVAACTCAPLPHPTPFDHTAFLVTNAGVIVAGTASDLAAAPPFDPQQPNADYNANIMFLTEEYLKGSGPDDLALDAYGLEVDSEGNIVSVGLAGCQMFDLGSPGSRFVLFFPPGSALDRDPGFCGGSAVLVGSAGDAYVAEIRAALQPVTATPGPSPPPTPAELPDTGGSAEGGHAQTILAIAAASVAALGCVVVWRRRSTIR